MYTIYVVPYKHIQAHPEIRGMQPIGPSAAREVPPMVSYQEEQNCLELKGVPTNVL
jgi:hypothetical protein